MHYFFNMSKVETQVKSAVEKTIGWAIDVNP